MIGDIIYIPGTHSVLDCVLGASAANQKEQNSTSLWSSIPEHSLLNATGRDNSVERVKAKFESLESLEVQMIVEEGEFQKERMERLK